MRLLSRHAHWIAAVLVLLGAIGMRIADPGPLANLRRSVFDAYLQLAPRTYDPALPVRIIDIDEASLARLGQWPWPRTRLATIVRHLTEAGAAVIALDMILPEPDRTSPARLLAELPRTPTLDAARVELDRLPSNDDALARAIAAGPVVLGVLATSEAVSALPIPPKTGLAFAGPSPAGHVPRFNSMLTSLPGLNEAGKGLGATNWVPDLDQIVRRLPILIEVGSRRDPARQSTAGLPSNDGTEPQPLFYPSLAVEALRVAQGAGTLLIKSAGASGVATMGQHTGVVAVRVGGVTLPTDGEGQLTLRFTHTDRRRYISAHTVLAGSFDPAEVQGRIVFIGASAAGLLDLRASPLDRSIPGVEIHAQAVEQMVLGDHLVRPDYATGLELVWLVVAGLGLAAIMTRTGATGGAVAGGVAVAVAFAASWVAYRWNGLQLDAVYPMLALSALYTMVTVVRFRGTETERAQIRAAFSRYMAPAMVEALAAHPERLKLGGETREITIMFLDVRGFTSLSEGMDAQDLTRFVNRLFTPVSNVILAHGGTIDKFIGDAVMAFWNAPLDDRDHRRNAARAALAIMIEIERLNDSLAGEAARQGRMHQPIRVGIGINTGPCCVGNHRSEQRFDYSVMGDAVNLTSRLEGLTKTYGVPILMGESTAEGLDGMAVVAVDVVRVRGKQTAVRAHALLGDAAMARTPAFTAVAERHREIAAAIAADDRMRLARALDAAEAAGFPELAALHAHLRLRASERGIHEAAGTSR